jgi:hypothetical protein
MRIIFEYRSARGPDSAWMQDPPKEPDSKVVTINAGTANNIFNQVYAFTCFEN